jgi:hypothetical protein
LFIVFNWRQLIPFDAYDIYTAAEIDEFMVSRGTRSEAESSEAALWNLKQPITQIAIGIS